MKYFDKYAIIFLGDIEMRVAICDDEKIFHYELIGLINEYQTKRHTDMLIDTYTDGKELIRSEAEYDIVFMDYQMNDTDGIEVSRRLREHNKRCIIIFISAYPDAAIDTFEVNTFRFLTKPVDKIKFFKALDDYQNIIDTDSVIVIKTRSGILKIRLNDIIYSEAKGKHCIIRTTDNTYELLTNLKSIEKLLPSDRFARCQRSYIAGFMHITAHNSKEIEFDNGEKAEIGSTYYPRFKTAFKHYIISANQGLLL